MSKVYKNSGQKEIHNGIETNELPNENLSENIMDSDLVTTENESKKIPLKDILFYGILGLVGLACFTFTVLFWSVIYFL